MPRKTESKALSQQAFWEVLREGQQPTVDRVNQWLDDKGHGRRDRNVVNDALKGCWTEVGDRIANPLAGLPEETIQLFVKLRADMLSVARDDLAIEKDAYEKAADFVKHEALESARVSAAKAEAAEAALRATETAYAGLQEQLARTTRELQDSRATHLEETRKSATLASELATARRDIERLNEDRADERLAAANDRKQQSLEIDRLREQVKATEANAKRTSEHLTAQNDKAQQDIHRLESALSESKSTIAQLQGAERIQATRVKDLSTAVDTAQAANADLRTELALARAENAQLQKHSEDDRCRFDGTLLLSAPQLNSIVRNAIQLGRDQKTLASKKGAAATDAASAEDAHILSVVQSVQDLTNATRGIG